MESSSDNYYSRVLDTIKERKERVAKGFINSVPWPFARFSEQVIGLEKKKIYQVTAGPKCGKSKIANFMFLYNTYDYLVENKLPINFKVKYFCLEESKETLVAQFMAYTLFTKSKGKTVVSVATLMSTEKELPQNIIDEIEQHQDYINGFLDIVEYIEDVSHPFGIFERFLSYSRKNGTQLKKKVSWRDEPVDDIYIPNNPDEIVLGVVDHVSLLKDKEAISELLKYSVTLRNKYGYSMLIIQQQALAQTSIEGIKFNKGEPTVSGLGDNKLTSRDVDITFGLYSPFQNEIPEYKGYNVKYYRDNIRFLSVLQSRHGGTGVKSPLFFHGAVNYFSELPKASTPEEAKTQKNIAQIRINEAKIKKLNE